MDCEVCGAKVVGPASRVEIDGAVLWVCASCAKRGKAVSAGPKRKPGSAYRARSASSLGPDLEVDPDYGNLVRMAREGMGITQEVLGRRINLKPSVISLIETKRMKPDVQLARKLEHELRIEILVPAEEGGAW